MSIYMYIYTDMDRITVVQDTVEFARALPLLLASLRDASRRGFPVVLGLDAEWVPPHFLNVSGASLGGGGEGGGSRSSRGRGGFDGKRAH